MDDLQTKNLLDDLRDLLDRLEPSAGDARSEVQKAIRRIDHFRWQQDKHTEYEPEGSDA